jgi:hypothetical protein
VRASACTCARVYVCARVTPSRPLSPQLCVRVAPERVLRRLAAILETERNLEFACVVVDALDLILLTAPGAGIVV